MNNFAWAIAGLVVSLVFVVLAVASPKIKTGGVGTRIAGLRGIFTRPLFIGLVVVVSLAVVAYWGFYTSLIPRPSDVGSWSWHHWLPLLVFLAIAWLVIELTVKKEPTKKTLQKALTRVMFMLFVGFPVGMWVASGLGITTALHASREGFNRPFPRDTPNLPRAWHLDQSKWPTVKVPAHGDSVLVRGLDQGHVVWGGSGFTVRCVYANGHIGTVGDPSDPCSDGNIVGSYAHNDSDVPLLASYAYARAGEK